MDRDGLTVVPEAAPSVGTPVQAHPTGGGAFRALHSRPFRLYFIGQVASASGTFLQQTAIGWLVFQLTGSAASLGLVLAAGGLPSLILGPWGGTLVDRVDLRKLLIATQAAYGLLAAVLWGPPPRGRHRSASSSPLECSADSSRSSIRRRGRPLSARLFRRPICECGQPERRGDEQCAGGWAVPRRPADRHGRDDAVLRGERGLVPGRHRRADRDPPARERVRKESAGGVREGLRYARSREQLWLPLTMMSLVELLAFNFAVLLPVFAEQTFHGTGGTYGLM